MRRHAKILDGNLVSPGSFIGSSSYRRTRFTAASARLQSLFQEAGFWLGPGSRPNTLGEAHQRMRQAWLGGIMRGRSNALGQAAAKCGAACGAANTHKKRNNIKLL
jgi:hypothetical protein